MWLRTRRVCPYNWGCTYLCQSYQQVETQLTREPKPFPTLHINKRVNSIFEIEMEDLTLEGYDPHPSIKAPVAV